jgi:hypothetical protein
MAAGTFSEEAPAAVDFISRSDLGYVKFAEERI